MTRKHKRKPAGSLTLRDRQANPDEESLAGLVLLYAPSFERLPPATAFRSASVTVGCAKDCDLVLFDGDVSPHNARFFFDGEVWWVEDTSGGAGVLVDGERVAMAALDERQELRVGDAIFAFVPRGIDVFARHRIDGVVLGEPPEQAEKRRARAIIGGAQVDLLVRHVERAAKSTLSVLLGGESGTGKELFAEHVHRASGRKGPFQAINCANLPEGRLESELFGAKRGAYTGADADRPGLLRAAAGGTVFLDEIGEMPLEVQAKLLRVTQTREVLPLGAARPERVDVRIVCATHRDLHAMQRAGTFRGDLYARLNEIPVRLPPLRERKEDVFQLATAMLAREKRSDIRLGMPFLAGLLHYDFPFNVRELEAAVRAAAALAETDVLGEEHLPAAIRAALEGYGARPPGEREPQGEADTTRSPHDMPPIEVLVESLANHRGNLAAVGRDHGKSRATVHRWMKRYGLNPDDFRSGESNEE